MSEYQFVAFRAIDGPVSEENLAFMERQSSRAEITPWSFDNEYHYGDFRGDAAEMLRRGYDIHLLYANFGVRTLMIRLPGGLPDPKAADPYFEEDSLDLLKDKQGDRAILSIRPFYEPAYLGELYDVDGFLERLLPVRAEILDGDLRPLYLAHLAIVCDQNHDPDEEHEGPVPAGLDELTDAQHALAQFYGLSDAFLAAVAEGSPPLPKARDPRRQYDSWLERQPEARKTAWLAQLLADPRWPARSEILAEYRKSDGTPPWPTVCLERSIVQLEARAEEIERGSKAKRAEEAAHTRARKLAELAADPERALRETEQLVKQRSTDAYQQAATLLADLREALSSSDQSELAEKQAQKLTKRNPTLKVLVSELRRKGFVKKSFSPGKKR